MLFMIILLNKKAHVNTLIKQKQVLLVLGNVWTVSYIFQVKQLLIIQKSVLINT